MNNNLENSYTAYTFHGINIKFLICNNGSDVVQKNACLTRYIIKYLGVKCHYVCDLFSNDSVVKLYIQCTHTIVYVRQREKRERERNWCKTLTVAESKVKSMY